MKAKTNPFCHFVAFFLNKKTRLKGLLENKKLSSPVRVGALSAILYSWKDKGDFTYLASKTKGNTKLTAHYTRIKTKLFANGGK